MTGRVGGRRDCGEGCEAKNRISEEVGGGWKKNREGLPWGVGGETGGKNNERERQSDVVT